MDQLASLARREPSRRPRDRTRRAPIGDGYGSECHLLRYMGRHRDRLEAAIVNTIPDSAAVRWLDFHFDPNGNWMDGERKALDFLAVEHPARTAWTWVWPHKGTPLTWDAVGVVKIGEAWEFLLVEAKAHIRELHSSCGAAEDWGRPLIRKAFRQTKEALGVDLNCDWLNGAYQYCNRITVLHHLTTHGAPAHLLWIYFTGDHGGGNRICPRDEIGWNVALAEQAERVGLPNSHSLSSRLHTLFLPVCPNT